MIKLPIQLKKKIEIGLCLVKRFEKLQIFNPFLKKALQSVCWCILQRLYILFQYGSSNRNIVYSDYRTSVMYLCTCWLPFQQLYPKSQRQVKIRYCDFHYGINDYFYWTANTIESSRIWQVRDVGGNVWHDRTLESQHLGLKVCWVAEIASLLEW